MLNMDTIGYFLFMNQEEQNTKESHENRSTDFFSILVEERPSQEDKEEKE